MKKFVLFITGLFITIIVLSQEKQDVVYLKNGSVIRGEIMEMIPDDHIKIETRDGNLFVYTFDEIEKMEKETVKSSSPFKNISNENDGSYFSDYFANSALGFAIGGGGILGLTYRYFLDEKIGIEGGVFYRPSFYLDYYDELVTSSTAMLTVGPVLYLKTSENWKGKIKKNGLSVKVGIAPVGELNEIFGSINWLHDTYNPRNHNRYFSFELGLGALNKYKVPIYADIESQNTILLYWKLNWFFHLN